MCKLQIFVTFCRIGTCPIRFPLRKRLLKSKTKKAVMERRERRPDLKLTWDRCYEAPFRTKSFRTNSHPVIMDTITIRNCRLNIYLTRMDRIIGFNGAKKLLKPLIYS
jgi:hypothetical protein